ncbi:hypothetical protein BX666DRAFT_2022418 [Dichotomocladium elegans]|nr:hypothetical protein BX666DRAFT_2022418 [Dichotomocladium elegans]
MTGDDGWNSSYWLKELAQISKGSNNPNSLFWKTGECIASSHTVDSGDSPGNTDEDPNVKENKDNQHQKEQRWLEDDKRDFTFDWEFPRPATIFPATDKNLLPASQLNKHIRFPDTSASEDEDEDNDDDEGSVEQITISFSTLMSSESQDRPTRPRQVERIECTFEDLLLGEKSDNIRNILAKLSGKEMQPADDSQPRDAINQISEDQLGQQVVEEVKKIPDTQLNAFAPSFVPSQDLFPSDPTATDKDTALCSSSSQSSVDQRKLNAFAPIFKPSSYPAATAATTPPLIEYSTETTASSEPYLSPSPAPSTPFICSEKLNPFTQPFVPSSHALLSSNSTTTAYSIAPKAVEYSQSSLDSLFAPPKFFHSSSTAATNSLDLLLQQQQQHQYQEYWNIAANQHNHETIATYDGVTAEQPHSASAPNDPVYFTTKAASVADLHSKIVHDE